jgi:hypothetical protein
MAILTAREILTGARDLLAVPGAWVKRQKYQMGPYGGVSGYCSVGAIDMAIAQHLHLAYLSIASPVDADQQEQSRRATAYLRRALGIAMDPWALMFTDIPQWNDAAERTLEEVLAAFDRAIELCCSEEHVQSDTAEQQDLIPFPPVVQPSETVSTPEREPVLV